MRWIYTQVGWAAEVSFKHQDMRFYILTKEEEMAQGSASCKCELVPRIENWEDKFVF